MTQTPLVDSAILRLWEHEPPENVSIHPEDTPTLQVFLPPPGEATGASFLVCPGGGYVILADHEGAPVAEWLAQHGITAFVLRYRRAFSYRHPYPFHDALRAVRYVRAHALEWELDPERIGMLGFSAGGHLTSMVATHPTDGQADAQDPVEHVSSHLNAQVLVYPVISADPNGGVWTNIIGKTPAPELLEFFRSNQHVTVQTPPAFLVHSTEDIGVPVQNSDHYAASLRRAKVPFTYIRGNLGDHGFGLQESWTQPCVEWLRTLGWAL